MNQNGNTPGMRSNPQKRVSQQPTQRPRNTRPNQVNQDGRPPSQARPQTSRPTSRPTPRDTTVKKPSGLSDNLRSQTPLQRQMRKKSAPSEPGTIRRTETQHFKIRSSADKRAKQNRKRTNRSFTKRVLLLGVICYLALLPITLLISNLLLENRSL